MQYPLFALASMLVLVLSTSVRAESSTTQTAQGIPLGSIFSTSSQKGLQHADEGPFVETTETPAVSGLAWAKDFNALSQAKLIQWPEVGKSAITLTRPPDADTRLWMVIYFGSTGSNPPQFLIDSVTVRTGNVLEVAYHHAPSGPVTMDLVPYVAWIPMGKGIAGKGAVRLVESGKVKQTRSWVIENSATTQSGTQSATQPAGSEAVFEIKCQKLADTVKVGFESGQAVFSITSPSGIGGATIERKGGHWPNRIVLRMRLGGLESLTITSGNVKLATSVQSGGDHARRLYLFEGNKEGSPLSKDSPYWLDIRAFDGQGKVVQFLPTDGGYFEMMVPKVLLDDQTKTMKLAWIDFYR